MRERTMAIGRLVALVVATLGVILLKPVQDDVRKALNVDVRKPATNVAAAITSDASTDEPKPMATKAHAEQPEVQKPAEPPRPTPWAVQASPNGGTDNVNKALAHYQNMGMTKQGAAMLVGNYLQEMPSAFTTGDPCHHTGVSDGGLALGFAQWHPGRRADMPCGFYEQLTWAVDVEMRRDGGGQKLRPLLFDPSATADQIDHGLKLWERYGVKGSRYQFGIDILGQL